MFWFFYLAAPLTQGMKVFAKIPPSVSLGLHLKLILCINTSGLAFLSFSIQKPPLISLLRNDVSFASHGSSETQGRAFSRAAWAEIPYPSLAHAGTLLHFQMRSSLEGSSSTLSSQLSRDPGWSRWSSSCSARLQSWQWDIKSWAWMCAKR